MPERYDLDKALSEAGQMKKLVGESGSPEDYELAHEIVEQEHIVENSELGVSYKEKVITLPEHRRQETGISRIRRKEVIEVPANFRTEPDHRQGPGYSLNREFHEIYKFLTEHRYPSFETWNHVMYADNPDFRRKGTENFLKEGLYFQKIHYNFERSWDSPETVKWLNEHWPSRRQLYDLSVEMGGQSWEAKIDTPMFIFGNRNKAFVEYIESIFTNPAARKIMEPQWDFDNPLSVVRPGSPEYNKILKEYLTMRADEFQKAGVLLTSMRSNMETKKFKNVNYLKFLIDGQPMFRYGGHHPYIPAIKHPDIKPLRWCHAEIAIVPTRNNLNVLFFETD
jgi:hypothetical protein